ncbi:MAG: heavy metal sensor signal transduction histidine kinase [Bryobacterales bacterium]|nr:heavy metal sensor signal transduction histidine kinase [Bryobacterales bacterium]
MSRLRNFRRITRSLRFRLTVGYALFFCIMLIGVGAIYRQKLDAILNAQIRDGLEQEWAAAKGYLRIEKGIPHWYFDRADPDESFIVGRIRRVYMLADANDNVMEISEVYSSIGADSAAEVASAISRPQPGLRIRKNAQGVPFLIYSGAVYDEDHTKQYFLAIGRSLAENRLILEQFTWIYLGVIPLVVLSGCLLGWYLAARALTPVLEVAQAANRISGSNLSLRIPSRGAHDELDYLIETFNRMIERLQNSFNQIRQFSTDVSHELRTPITAIRGQLEVALFTASTAEQYREAMLNSLQDVERLSQIVRALLLLSQAESGQLALQKTRLDLSELVADVVDQFQIPYEAAHVRLTSELPPECPAEVDRIQIERMLSNLLSNAMKFTPAGGEVRVTLQRQEDGVELAVEDTGYGIPTDHLPHIFDRFYRVPGSDSSGPERGLGLGLSFVSWIAKVHNGTVHVESTTGKGSRFVVFLPVSTATSPQPADIPVPSGMNEL